MFIFETVAKPLLDIVCQNTKQNKHLRFSINDFKRLDGFGGVLYIQKFYCWIIMMYFI